MSKTRLELVEVMRILLSDTKDQKWSKATKEHFLNQALSETISTESVPYVRVAEIPIRDDVYEYDFPEDMIEPLAMMMQDIEGAVVINSSWRTLMAWNVMGNSMIPQDNEVFWQQSHNYSGYVTIRDIVSDDKFIFTPKYQANLFNYTVHRQATLPAAASEHEMWVDTYNDEFLVYQCDETYSAAAELATATIEADLLPGTTDLVFTYTVAGVKYVNVVIVRAGATGTTGVVITGDAADRANPLTYTFNVYDNNSSNDTIIALAPTNLTITGSSATTGTVTPTEITLVNPSESKWEQKFLHLRYKASIPALATDTDTLPSSLHVLIRNGDCLAYLASGEILSTVKGDERILIMSREFAKKGRNTLDRVRKHRGTSGPPFDLEPA